MYKTILKITLIISLLLNSSRQGYALRPMAEARTQTISMLENEFSNFKKPFSLLNGIRVGINQGLILSPAKKKIIYKVLKEFFLAHNLDETLREIGVESYALFCTSSISPERVAVKRSSDIDLCLAVNVNSEAQLGQVAEAVKNLTSLTCLEQGRYDFGFLVSLDASEALRTKDVKRKLDIFIKNIYPFSGQKKSIHSLLKDFYSLNMPMEILLSRNFSMEKERRRLERYLLAVEPPDIIGIPEHLTKRNLIRTLRRIWFSDIELDYYHLLRAGVKKKHLHTQLNLLEFQEFCTAMRDCLPEATSRLEAIETDLRYFREHHYTTLLYAGPTKQTRNIAGASLAHAGTGNYSRIIERILLHRKEITRENVASALEFYESLRDRSAGSINIKYNLSPLQRLRMKILNNSFSSLEDLPGFPVFHLLAEDPKVIEEALGIESKFIVLSLVIDTLLCSKQHKSSSDRPPKEQPNFREKSSNVMLAIRAAA